MPHPSRSGPSGDHPAGQAIQLAFATAPHRNQQLFSDHVLDDLLPSREDWQMLAGEATPVLTAITALWQRFVPSTKEVQTEDDLVKPVLKFLGHVFEIQPSLETPDGTKAPDYVFYQDQAMRDAAKGRKLTDSFLQGRAYAVGDAKHWERPLDTSVTVGSDFFSNKNPSYQISFYLQHSGLEWGILTNGRLWRLYHKETAHKLDRFYEVDLPALLATGDVQQFLYFYAFFRRQAFEPGDLGVSAFLQASANYARQVGNSLKEQVYDALRHVAQGLLDYPANHLQPEEVSLERIYRHALIVLYRVLFILYAEARDLLPLREHTGYRETYSLESIKKAIEHDIKAQRVLLPTTAKLWPELKTLFTLIHEGSPPLKVATFNGGLFDPARHPFLEQHSIGDAHLQQAIDKLARVEGQFVDYRDLAERHLGTIYEGLLEFHLEPLETPEDGWTVALVNAKGERKATGSYYTPDYIVKYMVEETLGPLLRRAVAGARSDQEKIERILALKILDPAMGSGHFPVEVMEYIARFLVQVLEQPQTEAGGEADLAYWKRRVAQACIYGVDLNPLAVDLAKLSLWLATAAKDRPLSFLDHHLRPGNSLIGARLSDLWLEGASTSAKKPSKKAEQAAAAGQLTLFDADTLRQSMTSAVNAMWQIESSPAQTVAQVKEQEQTYSALRQALMDRYQTLAHLVTATHFGLEIHGPYWKALADYATGRVNIALPQFAAWMEQAKLRAEELSFFHWELEFPEVFFDRLGQPKEAAGFDAVISNPPYIRQEGLGALKPYLAAAYPETYHGVADIYTFFYQQGLRLTRSGGRMAYIVTNKWMRSGYGEGLRAYFAQSGALERIIDFGHAPIFEDADVFPCILVLEKPDPSIQAAAPMLSVDGQSLAERQVQIVNFPREVLGRVPLGSYIRDHSYSVPQGRFGRAAWTLETSAVDELLAKVRQNGVPLAQYAGVKLYRGILTGLNEAFLIDTATKDQLIKADPFCAEIIRPYLRGQDIKRWSPEWAGLWMILLKSSGDQAWPWSSAADETSAEQVFQQTYPALHAHMKSLESKLRKRQDQGRCWWELRACAYYALFEQPKLMYQEIQFHPAYGLDSQGFISNNKTFFLSSADPYLLAVLNSPLMWWHNWRYLPHMKDEALSPVGVLMETLPIAPPSEAIRAQAEPAVMRLIELARANQEARRVTMEWLRGQFEVETLGGTLEDFAALDFKAFQSEVSRRRRRTAKPLTPNAVKALEAGYIEQAMPLRERMAESAKLERKLADLVNAAYGLTAEEVALLWETAPPRMPKF
jgi:hypothetical protein